MDKLRRTISGSATSALAALFMVGAIAFGSTVIRPMTAFHDAEATATQDDGRGSATEPSGDVAVRDQPDGTAPGNALADVSQADACFVQTEQGYCEEFPHGLPSGGEQPKDPPTNPPVEEPKEEPTDPPADPAPSGTLQLSAFIGDYGKITVEWSAYTGDFEKYKLVRSTDAAATWPLGEGDTLVGVIGAGGETRFVDGGAPCGIELHYRVFAVRHDTDGYVVLASSNVDGAMRECVAPPTPTALAMEISQGPGGVTLSWQACTADGFAVYKVVRSATNPDPVYPLNDGTQLIGVIGDAGVTGFTDTAVAPGQTWTYRVLCMGNTGGGWFALALTAAITVTVE